MSVQGLLEPVPAGAMTFYDCIELITTSLAGPASARTIIVYKHKITGELKIDPPIEEIRILDQHYEHAAELLLFALRDGLVEAFLGDTSAAMPVTFWRSAAGRRGVEDGAYKGKLLLLLRSEALQLAHGLRAIPDAAVGNEALGGPGSSPKPQQSSCRAERDCRKWLIEWMQREPDHAPVKKQVLTEAQVNFLELSQEAFNRAWSKAMQETGATAWGRPGRIS